MTDQKLENMLNLALDATEAEREKSLQLNVGYDPLEKQWEVIVKYSGDLREVLGDEIPIVELLNGFAILTVPQSLIERLTDYPQIEFIEKPKRLFFAVNQGKSASCMTSVQSQFSPLGMPLTGKGILVACVEPSRFQKSRWHHQDSQIMGSEYFGKSAKRLCDWDRIYQ